MTSTKLLIANRGEIAIRIAQTAAELNIPSLSVYSTDDVRSLHTKKTDERVALTGSGVAAYLNGEELIALAKKKNCTCIHPGYGFLSENAAFAQKCADNDLIFIGPQPKVLSLFGDKIAARQLAIAEGISVVNGTNQATSLEEVKAFAAQWSGSIMIKAISGGGGRGMRIVRPNEDIAAAYERCQSEALQAFGNGEVYVEQLVENARHIEVQVLGDGQGEVVHFGERDCSIQRRQQKLIEIAPCPDLSEELRERLIRAALKLAKAVDYQSLGTFEFLVENLSASANFYFIEVNPRLQVEHTITEEVYGVDLVQLQIQQALGQSFADLNLSQEKIGTPQGYAIQLRINTESIDKQGLIKWQGGQISAYMPPTGKGVRVDAAAYVGYQNSPNFDALIAKVIVFSKGNFQKTSRKAARALAEMQLSGIETNLNFLKNILLSQNFLYNVFNTTFVIEQLPELLINQEKHSNLYFQERLSDIVEKTKILDIPVHLTGIQTPMTGRVVAIKTKVGETIQKGQELLVVEAMKMESAITAEESGVVEQILVQVDEIIDEEQYIILYQLTETIREEVTKNVIIDLDEIRPDLAEVLKRQALLMDAKRPQAVAKRRRNQQQTARENIAQLCDTDSFQEYGGLTFAAQRRRRSLEDLIINTPADGIVAGTGTINAEEFSESDTRCVVMAYDFTVLAGTQGWAGHKKMDRLFHLAEEWKIPIVLLAEGGGGRPGDTDFAVGGGLDVMTFAIFAKMSGLVPRVAIVSRYCFAGNAALAGCADVLIATENVSIGMGGPAMIEGGGLGQFHPKEVGPASFQTTNGVIDILVKDEVEGVEIAKKYLSYFQGKTTDWECADQRLLRRLIPENRRRVFDIHQVITTIADENSVLELRQHFGLGMITALIRVEGRPLGLIANNSKYLGGAIDSEGADKAARFIQLCDAFGLPIVSLCDTPGIMVGPDAEKSGTVRHASRLFVVGSTIKVPFMAIVLRKGYGLGVMAMMGGSFHIPIFTVSWPTGEFGGMGLEGAVRLGFKKELAACKTPEEQQALYEKLVAKMYQEGKALSMASYLEIDNVIDPVASRKWIVSGMNTARPKDSKRRIIDTW